ncbi:unnamed protein product [Hymenolepis diminuta]|uniref:Uncharacterized protein n=1 Tax=Hymenolepis diminuta TaxID=6216 RepID=A0A564Y7L3_HYMDI|nr:unnamed protein product [Hymenolepis diminuta]
MTNEMFCSRYKSKRPKPRGRKGQVLRKRNGTTVIKVKAILKNFWTSAHPGLAGKSPMEIVMRRRSRPNTSLKKE